jgi:hypothetical protein
MRAAQRITHDIFRGTQQTLFRNGDFWILRDFSTRRIKKTHLLSHQATQHTSQIEKTNSTRIAL